MMPETSGHGCMDLLPYWKLQQVAFPFQGSSRGPSACTVLPRSLDLPTLPSHTPTSSNSSAPFKLHFLPGILSEHSSHRYSFYSEPQRHTLPSSVLPVAKPPSPDQNANYPGPHTFSNKQGSSDSVSQFTLLHLLMGKLRPRVRKTPAQMLTAGQDLKISLIPRLL